MTLRSPSTFKKKVRIAYFESAATELASTRVTIHRKNSTQFDFRKAFRIEGLLYDSEE